MFILSFFLFFGASSPQKISHLTALLQFKDPHSKKAPYFTISAEGGCFNWTSLNSDIVRVIPKYQSERCSTSAIVESVAEGPLRRSTAILAESNLGTTLRCDIFVDSVKKISILTTTRSIYFESSNETLSLLATDSENNTFTSLEGTEINWKIDKDHLRTISSDDAKLFLNKSSSIIIQGKKIGKTWVEATLNGIHHAHVDLNVVKALTFLPFPIIRTMPYHHIPFKLFHARRDIINQNAKITGTPIGVTVDKNYISHVYESEYNSTFCISQIQLPSDSYTITSSNPKSMIVNQSAFATTLEPGQSTIIASDVSINDNTASTLVYVMYPSIVYQPEQYIALGDDPVFHPILKDRDGIPLDIFEEIKWDIQGEWKTVGKKHIKLTYHDFSFDAIVHVCPPIIMDPPEAVLPENYNGFVVEPKGGSGFYEFEVDDQRVLSYSDFSHEVRTRKEGRTKIRVKDKKISKFNNFSYIIVSKVAYVDIQIERRELIDQDFQPKCQVFAIENKNFSVEMHYKTYSTHLDVVSSQMKPQNPGFSNIYCEDEHDHVKSAEILVSTASNLIAKVNGRGSPRSSIPLSYTGGVLAWNESHPPTINVTCPNANVTKLSYNYFSVDREYSGYCTAVMQNIQSDLNPYPLRVATEFWLNVSNVYRFDVYVKDEHASDNPKCRAPLKQLQYEDVIKETFKNRIKAYRIITGNPHIVYVFPRDIDGNIINYYSAVNFKLQTSLGETLNYDRHGYLDETVYSFTPYKSTDLSVISPNISQSVISLIEIKPIKLPAPQTIYYKENKVYTFPIEDGSGYYKTQTPNADFYNGNLQYSPQKPGTQTISVSDFCTDQPSKRLNLNAVSVEILKIYAPSCVFVNTEFDVQVKAYGQKSILIPEALLPEAAVKFESNYTSHPRIDTWRLSSPNKECKIYLQATAENGVSATATVDVIESLILSPQYIELLPGDKCYLKIISGPSEIQFEHEDYNGELIAEVGLQKNSRYAVTGLTPGNITINAYIKRHELMQNMQPFRIYVRVLRPISLVLKPTSETPIQTGYVGLRLFVLTDAGYRIPRKAEWNWQIQQSKELQGYNYLQINDSFAFVNLSSPSLSLAESHVNDILVEVEAFTNINKSLKTVYSSHIEPRLIITTPSLIILPPHCTYQIRILNYGDINMIKDCIFKPDDESIVNVNCDGLITSFSTEGQTTINVIYGHQKLSIEVRVSKPAFLHIHQKSFSDIHIMLLDPYGLLYSSVNGIKYSLSGPTGFTSSQIDSRGLCSVQFPSEQIIELHAAAFNSEFILETSINLSVKQRITPSNVFLMKGASLNFQCTALKPTWSSSDSSALYVSSSGTATGIRSGEVKIICGKNIQSKVTVVEMVDLKLTNEPNEEFRILPTYSIPIHPSDKNDEELIFKEPSDLQFKCIFEETRCASAQFKKNGTGRYCVLNRILKNNLDYSINETGRYEKCSPDAKLKVVVLSESAGLNLSAEALISSGDIDFGIPKYSRHTVSSEKLNVRIPLKFNESEISIKKPRYFDYRWENESILVISVDPSFTTQGTVVIKHNESGEKRTIEIIHEASPGEGGNREFKLSKEILFFVALVAMFGSISYIIFILTSDD